MARFGLAGFRSSPSLARSWVRGERGQALFAGRAGQAVLPIDDMPSAAIGLMLHLAGHAVGGDDALERHGDAALDALAAIGSDCAFFFAARGRSAAPRGRRGGAPRRAPRVRPPPPPGATRDTAR